MTGEKGSSVAGQPRFLQLADVAEILNISAAQAYALVRRGELKAVKIGGRGQWRVEASELEAFIQRSYDQTDEFIISHPFGADDGMNPPDEEV
jgi:excisionase family DNA binding protein